MSSSKRDDPLAELIGEFADRLRGDHWQPEVDLFETEKAFVVRVDLAGVQGPDLRVTVDGDELRIRGMRRPPEPGDLRRLHRIGKFMQKHPITVTIGVGVVVGLVVLGIVLARMTFR